MGSTTIFWIDELIYFGFFWNHEDALMGPFFLVHEDSRLGEYLKEQVSRMSAANS